LIYKVFRILSSKQKKLAFLVLFLLLISIFFEIGGLGILLPAISLMLNPDIEKTYPFVSPYLKKIGNPSRNSIVIIVMSILIIYYLIKTLFFIYSSWKQSKFNSEVSGEISEKLFRVYINESYSFHLHRNSTELSRNINETSIFTTVLQSFFIILTEITTIIGISLTLIFIEPIGAISVALFLGILVLLFQKITKNRLLSWGEMRHEISGNINKHISHSFGGIKDIKLLGLENFFTKEFNKENNTLINVLAKYSTLSQLPRFYLEFISVFALSGLIALMIFQNKSIDILVPILGIFAAAAFRLVPSVNRIISSMQQIRYSTPYISKLIIELTNHNNRILIEHTTNKILPKECIAINNLSFKYQNNSTKVLNKINLNIKIGQSVGLIGTSGSGKSTLVDILLGLIKPDEGNVVYDGKNIENNIRNWQNNLGYVPQNIFLIDDTIESNIAFGIPQKEIDTIALQKAINDAQLTDFINSLKDGIYTKVGERGVRLSGGQRQRIGIARALYRNPSILVLDEATSALDNQTEMVVMNAINNLKKEKTLIIIAHRLTTVNACDIIYKMSNGQIVQSGPPSQILS
jgi:ABC-type multidrug transport system fused ATPase/permease subunit